MKEVRRTDDINIARIDERLKALQDKMEVMHTDILRSVSDHEERFRLVDMALLSHGRLINIGIGIIVTAAAVGLPGLIYLIRGIAGTE